MHEPMKQPNGIACILNGEAVKVEYVYTPVLLLVSQDMNSYPESGGAKS